MWKNWRRPDSEADVPVWTPTATRPIPHGGYRTRHSPGRCGAGGRTTTHISHICTGAPWIPRGGERCVLCQRLPSATTCGSRTIRPKRGQIVYAMFIRRCRAVHAGSVHSRPPLPIGGPTESVVPSRATDSPARHQQYVRYSTFRSRTPRTAATRFQTHLTRVVPCYRRYAVHTDTISRETLSEGGI